MKCSCTALQGPEGHRTAAHPSVFPVNPVRPPARLPAGVIRTEVHSFAPSIIPPAVIFANWPTFWFSGRGGGGYLTLANLFKKPFFPTSGWLLNLLEDWE